MAKIEKEVPRVHVHVYEVKDTMVEVDLVSNMTSVEAREMAIAIVKQGQNVQKPIKSDSKYIAVSFRLDDKHSGERETIIPCFPGCSVCIEMNRFIDVKKMREVAKELNMCSSVIDVKKAKKSLIEVIKALKLESGGKICPECVDEANYCQACGRNEGTIE